MPRGDLSDQVCKVGEEDAARRFFEVNVVRACDLTGDCDSASAQGIVYNRRHQIRDPKAIVYVADAGQRCDGDACDELERVATRRPPDQALRALRQEFAAGRPIEPLVMRAAAGECLHVVLRNLLPATAPDVPGVPGVLAERDASHDRLPMIADGFNLNQFRMSSSVGFSVPRLSQHPLLADGSNIGLNGAVLLTRAWRNNPRWDRAAHAERQSVQGSLVAPCGPVAPGSTAALEARCTRAFLLSTREPGRGREPVEFGALPVRSFGDAIQHPMHGLIGAVVVGPPNSEVCADNSFKNTRLSADMCVPAAAPRRPRRYVDHVLLVQDAVNALQGDMPVRNLSGAEEPDDYGMKALNYRSEPLWARRGGDPSVGFTERNESDYSTVMSSAMEPDPARANGRRCRAGIAMLDGRCEPETPILTATTGSTVRLHFVHAGGHTRQQGLAIGGHHWNPYPWSPDSRELRPEQGSSIQQGVFNGFGPMMGVSLEFTAGPPRDYLVNSMASFAWDGGTWGLLRVRP